MGFLKSLRRNRVKRTLNFIELWDEIAAAHIHKNNSNYGETRTKNFYVDLLGFYSSEDNVSYCFSIDGYPSELEISYRSTIRALCRAGVRVSFVSPLEKHDIAWSSPQMRAKLNTWRTLDKDSEEVEVDEYNLHKNIASMDSQDWRKDSLVYLSLADIRRKRKLFIFRSFMIVSGKRGDDFNTSVEEIKSLCENMGIKLSRVIGDIPEYLKVLSPFSNTFDSDVLRKCGSTVLTDELLARFNTYAQGTIGRYGIYWGTDIFSWFPCFKPMKRTAETAENILVSAETGGGKSYQIKGVALQLLADSKYNGTIMDIEGDEYATLADYISGYDLAVIINMAEGSGRYYDPVEIVVTGDPELDCDMYSLSTSFTLSLFKTLLGDVSEVDEWVDIVITDATALTYGEKNIDAYNMSTWGNSKGLTLYAVYKKLKELKISGDPERALSNANARSIYEQEMLGLNSSLEINDVNSLVVSNEGYQLAIDKCIAKLSRYFEPNGVKSYIFRDRITIDQIKDAKLVICSFGMKGRAPNTVDPIQMALMQLYSANISHLRSVFSKSASKYNFKVWEEFQRWGGFPDADKTINVALTGGRKLGDVNIIITNKIKDMLDDDKFGVFQNITSFAIGCIVDADVREEVCRRLSIPEMKDELDKIAINNKDLSAYVEGDTVLGNPYSKAFLLGLDRTAFTIARMSLPSELSESALFKTGVKE